jgi:protein-glutamine gamma-glutamyltransferase
VVVVSLPSLVAIAYFVWKRRRRNVDARTQSAARRLEDARAQSVAALYRTLETVLQQHGITRPPSTPPLRHAEELRTQRHPLAPEVLSLTNVYLEARFGEVVLTEADRREFERRVRELRAYRAPVVAVA